MDDIWPEIRRAAQRDAGAPLTRVRQMLQLQAPPPTGPLRETAVPPDPIEAALAPAIEPRICPHCHQGRLIFIRTFARGLAMGP
jgi:hypothetical protein